MEYENGVYTTHLYNSSYDWNESPIEEYKTDKAENVYVLETYFEIEGAVKFGDEKFEFKGDDKDVVTSKVIFGHVNNKLRPIMSEKTVKSTSPMTMSPSKLESAYRVFNYKTTVYYNYDLTETRYTFVDLSEDGEQTTTKEYAETFKITPENTFDNEQLLFAIRGMTISSSFNEALNVLNISANAMQTVNVTYSASSAVDTAKITTENGVTSFSMTGGDTTVAFYDVKLAISSNMPGVTQTAKYFARTTANDYRCAMYSLTSPLPYALGTLTYTLKTAEFTNK